MVKKSERMGVFVKSVGIAGDAEAAGSDCCFDPCYLGYFECFNTQRYYEAHDVLEHLWLKGGRDAPEYSFYKGLIQLAGGFVHLKLHHAQPTHPKHGLRLSPAKRLFLRSVENLSLYLTPESKWHGGIDLTVPIMLGGSTAALLDENPANPWTPERAPLLPMPYGLT